jgi:hypothetical protein
MDYRIFHESNLNFRDQWSPTLYKRKRPAYYYATQGKGLQNFPWIKSNSRDQGSSRLDWIGLDQYFKHHTHIHNHHGLSSRCASGLQAQHQLEAHTRRRSVACASETQKSIASIACGPQQTDLSLHRTPLISSYKTPNFQPLHHMHAGATFCHIFFNFGLTDARISQEPRKKNTPGLYACNSTHLLQQRPQALHQL